MCDNNFNCTGFEVRTANQKNISQENVSESCARSILNSRFQNRPSTHTDLKRFVIEFLNAFKMYCSIIYSTDKHISMSLFPTRLLCSPNDLFFVFISVRDETLSTRGVKIFFNSVKHRTV